ncbi:hypothetical protein V498_04053 [Pseudogymnoascus sp. VKM F-4517 (FW-2822)]|nr:hypothetical protein V498_04053 [Pseudogymnoascus sp. VKM F-4517 (FW-2822)]
MIRSRDNETVHLSNGNTIGLAHYGDSDGPVVFYFHGLGASRLEGAYWAKAAESVGAHIIALDRPGIGLSSAQPKRKLLDWPLVVSEVAQNLKIDQFYVLGTTAGGSHALVCAKELSPDTLKGVGLVGSWWPMSMTIGNMMKLSYNRWGTRHLYKKTIISALNDPDPTVFHKQDLEVSSYRESCRQGPQGVFDDYKIVFGEWRCDIRDISSRNIGLWCGTEDYHSSIDENRNMEKAMKHATLVEFEGDTHHTTLATRGEQILRGLLFGDEKSDWHLLKHDDYN